MIVFNNLQKISTFCFFFIARFKKITFFFKSLSSLQVFCIKNIKKNKDEAKEEKMNSEIFIRHLHCFAAYLNSLFIEKTAT